MSGLALWSEDGKQGRGSPRGGVGGAFRPSRSSLCVSSVLGRLSVHLALASIPSPLSSVIAGTCRPASARSLSFALLYASGLVSGGSGSRTGSGRRITVRGGCTFLPKTPLPLGYKPAFQSCQHASSKPSGATSIGQSTSGSTEKGCLFPAAVVGVGSRGVILTCSPPVSAFYFLSPPVLLLNCSDICFI